LRRIEEKLRKNEELLSNLSHHTLLILALILQENEDFEPA
jgi:hypothetical protein